MRAARVPRWLRPISPARIPASYSEAARQTVHMGFGAAALLLRYLTWYEAALLATAALLFNLRLLRTVSGGRLHRPGELDQAVPAGLVLYPASILLLLVMLPSRPDIVAAAWGIMAVGDGAATLAGRRFGTRSWPWNRQKTVEGSLALVLAGGTAGALLAWWCRPAVLPPPPLWFSLGAPIAAALIAAVVETAAIRLDDNLSVPLSAAAILWALSLVHSDLVLAAVRAAPPLVAVALPLNTIAAGAGYVLGGVTLSGAIAGGIIGAIVFVCTGWAGWLMLVAAFLCATVTSRLGLHRKALLGIDEDRGGRRGAGNAVANTGIAAGAACLSVASPATVPALIAFAAALTAGASDTIASEIGKAWGRHTWSLAPPGLVRPGTPGGMSLEGSAAGLVGAAGLATLALALGLIPVYGLLPVVAGAAAGSLVESVLGATCEAPGLLDNNALNLINTGVAALVAVALAGRMS